MKNIIVIVLTLLLISCSSEVTLLAPQQFDGNVYQIEVRPGPKVLKGFNEFVLIVSDRNRQPVPDFIISARVDDNDAWRQMIQDGNIGVYRRAVNIKDPQTQILQVQVRKAKEQLTILKFSLTPKS